MTDRRPNWYSGELLAAPGPGRVFFTTDAFPLFYLQITKCGCTFLRNLLYALDHGTPHPAAGRVHAHDEDFVKAGLIPGDVLARSPHAFAVLRDPVDRFLSLYFDKIADTTNTNDEAMRRRVVRAAKLDVGPGTSLATHRENCMKTLDWFERNLAGKTKGRVNPHWQRQVVRLSRTGDVAPRLLTLDGLSWQLPRLLSPIIPDIASRMAAVRVRNSSKKPFSRAEIETPALAERVHSVYLADLETYRRASADWGPAPSEG